MHNNLSRLMGISVLKPVSRNIETHGEISEKPTKNHPPKKIKDLKKNLNRFLKIPFYFQ